MAKLKLYTVVTPQIDYPGLTQIIGYWEREGWIDRITIPIKPDLRFISWVGRIGGLALEPSNVERISTPYEYVLACQYRATWKKYPKVLPWTHYIRDWASFEKVREEMSKTPFERKTLSIFSGTIRTGRSRNLWINSTEIFSYRNARNYKRTNTLYKTYADYYRALASSKYGLCPVGDGPVCQREIETMGLGCVPIYTPGVEWERHVSPQENVHYIFAKDPAEMKEKINAISDKQREEMSKNTMEYFDKYISPKGMWDAVLTTIEKYNIKVD
jgi:hypothetical protein